MVDGSILPNALGVNPSLTISALASRIAEQITGNKNIGLNNHSHVGSLERSLQIIGMLRLNFC